MVKAIGPTVPRWQLGERLTRLREEAGMSFGDVADEMDCSEWKIRRIEQGQVGVTRPELRTLLDLYDVEDREPLEELQQLGRQRGWWSRYSRYLAPNHANLLGIESAAVSIKADIVSYAAAMPLLRAAGGKVTTLSGADAVDEDTQKIGSNGLVHDELLEALRDL